MYLRATRSCLLPVAIAVLISATLVHSASLDPERDNGEIRQSGGSWFCASWIPIGFQTNLCRVFCVIFMNRLPPANTTGCVNGFCDCSSS